MYREDALLKFNISIAAIAKVNILIDNDDYLILVTKKNSAINRHSLFKINFTKLETQLISNNISEPELFSVSYPESGRTQASMAFHNIANKDFYFCSVVYQSNYCHE